MNDIDLIKKYLDGDKKSFGKIYDNYVDKIYKFVYIKVNNIQFTEDIVSDIFITVLNNIDSFKLDSSSSFKAWIYKISYNKVIDFYKKSSREQTEDLGDYLETSFYKDISIDIDNKNKLHEVFSYLNSIKKEHRDIIIYRVWDGLSFNEISEITGLSLSNCKKISSRILGQINKNFIILLFILII